MEPQRWNHIDELFHRMLAMEPEERHDALSAATKGDEELRREVASLLAAYESASGTDWSSGTAVSHLAQELLGKGIRREEAPGPGDTLGRFRVLDLLGVGGMGAVYRAFDPELRRVVALKVLAQAEGLEAHGRLAREAQAASALRHPTIATIHEIGEDRGRAFIVMECVEGESLARRLHDGPFAVPEAVNIARQVAESLEEAHRHGIVHHDIKPANVMLTPRRGIKVLDFGLAQHPALDGRASARQAGLVRGTPEAMSPEQAAGRPVDHRSDLFSLGVLLHHLLTGRSPFAGASVAETVGRILNAPPPPLPRGVPAEVERIVTRCLTKEREQRYSSASEVLVDLRAVAGQLEAEARPRVGWLTGRDDAGRWRRLALGACLLTLVAVAAGSFVLWRAAGAERSAIRSLAVLPLADFSPPPRESYFADGLTEALTIELAKIGALKVIAHSSVLSFRDRASPVSAIAQRLGVDALLTGSVTRVDGRVRVTVQLVSGATDRGLWAETYERAPSDVLALQGEVARAVAREIRLRLTPEDESRLRHEGTVDPVAYESFLRGRYFWNRRSEDDLEKAIASFSQVIHRQPEYALAHVGLADCYALLGPYGNRSPETTYPQAELAARRALALDPSLGEAHAVLGLVLHEYAWDHRSAEQSFRRAIELSPGNATAYQWYAEMLTRLGRHHEARLAIREAQRLDPLSLIVNSVAGWVDYQSGRSEPAVVELRRTLDLDPRFVPALSFLGLAQASLGRFPEALAAHREAASLSGRTPRALADLGVTLVQAGHPDEARTLLSELEAAVGGRRISAFHLAELQLALGERSEALDWLERASEDRGFWMLSLKVDPRLAALRGDPRFEALLTRTGLR